MKSRIEEYITKALEAIDKVHFKTPNGSIPKEYKGYVSSLGAAIIQSGLLTAITFYEAKENGSEEDRSRITDAIHYIIDEAHYGADISLSDLVRSTSDKQQLANKILDAATALKLVIRTYVLE